VYVVLLGERHSCGAVAARWAVTVLFS